MFTNKQIADAMRLTGFRVGLSGIVISKTAACEKMVDALVYMKRAGMDHKEFVAAAVQIADFVDAQVNPPPLRVQCQVVEDDDGGV